MVIYPRILTEDVQATYLGDPVILHFLRNVSDLDVDLSQPDVDPGLARAREQLRVFLRDIEDETLWFYTDQQQTGADRSTRFDGAVTTREQGVALDGYVAVTEQSRQAQATEDEQAAIEGRDADAIVPRYPDDTLYEAGAPNVVQMPGDLLMTLRSTIADVAEHEVKRPDRHVKVKSEGRSREEYVLTERPRQLYHRLNRFDRTSAWY